MAPLHSSNTYWFTGSIQVDHRAPTSFVCFAWSNETIWSWTLEVFSNLILTQPPLIELRCFCGDGKSGFCLLVWLRPTSIVPFRVRVRLCSVQWSRVLEMSFRSGRGRRMCGKRRRGPWWRGTRWSRANLRPRVEPSSPPSPSTTWWSPTSIRPTTAPPGTPSARAPWSSPWRREVWTEPSMQYHDDDDSYTVLLLLSSLYYSKPYYNILSMRLYHIL